MSVSRPLGYSARGGLHSVNLSHFSTSKSQVNKPVVNVVPKKETAETMEDSLRPTTLD